MTLFSSYDFFSPVYVLYIYVVVGSLYMCVSPFYRGRHPLLVLCMPVAVYYLIYSSDCLLMYGPWRSEQTNDQTCSIPLPFPSPLSANRPHVRWFTERNGLKAGRTVRRGTATVLLCPLISYFEPM